MPASRGPGLALAEQSEQAQTRCIAHGAEDARGTLDGARAHEGGGRTGAVIVGGAGGVSHFRHATLDQLFKYEDIRFWFPCQGDRSLC